MAMQKWSLHIQSKQIELERGKVYLLGSLETDERSNVCIALLCEGVDPKHCTIEVFGDKLQILDLCSQTGTFVNNIRLEPMYKVSVNKETAIRFGMLTGKLYTEASREQSLDSSGFGEEQQKVSDTNLTKSPFIADDFLAPEVPLSKSSLINTSTRLFDDDSFVIPETQHAKWRVSTDSKHNVSNASGEDSLLHKDDVEEDSFIPETQQPLQSAMEADVMSSSDADTNIPKSCGMFRICTQDFNENLFNNNDNDEAFTSLVIPQIQHKPIVLENVHLEGRAAVNIFSDSSKDQNNSYDAEMDALNWTAQTVSKDNIAQDAQSEIREDTCTPDLFDLPELAQVNAQITSQNYCKAGKTSGNQIVTSHTGEEFADKVIGDNEGELLPTQVFVPIPKKEKQQENALSEKLSLSGKENDVPENANISLEVTQVFSKSKGEENHNNNPNQLEHITSQGQQEDLETISLYAATQVFSANKGSKRIMNSSIATKALNSTFMPTKPNEQVKSAASFFADIENPLQGSNEKETVRIETETTQSFKKPKSEIAIKNVASSCDNLSLPETEDLHLCTPKWISDNFDKLAKEQKAIAVKRRTLFGSDSEDELDNVNKLVQKKVSNDFGKLLSKINMNKEKSNNEVPQEANQLLIKNLISTQHSKNSTRTETKVQEKSTVDLRKPKIRIKRVSQIASGSNEINQKDSSTSLEKSSKEDKPARRSTRLRSQASTVVNSDLQAKQINDNDKKGVKKSRLLRSTSKTESSDSVTTVKTVKKSKSQESCIKQSRQQVRSNDVAKRTSSRNSSCEALNGLSSCEKPESQESNSSCMSTNSRKRITVTETNEARKRLRSTSTRECKLQVATTMVDADLIQRLLDTSSGTWCISTDPIEADVLIMDKGTRTLKFLLAMAKGIPIVSSKWLEAYNATKIVPKGMDFFFKDPEFEKRHKFSLLRSLDIARKKKLFEGYEFLTTSAIVPQPSEIKDIIKCAGGIIHDEVPPTKSNQKIYLVSAPNDKKHWHKYRRANANICITSTEGIMAAVMRQQTNTLEKYRLS